MARKVVPPAEAEDCDSKRISHVTLYSPKMSLQSSGGKRRIHGFHFFFFLIYVYQLYWVWSTVGEPYRKFLEKADREGFKVMEGTNKMRAELEHAVMDLDDPNRRTGKIGWFDWMDMDIEEHAAQKRREKEQSVLDSLPKNMRVPSKRSASFWSMLTSGFVGTLHALVMLLQHWSVGFCVMLNYTARKMGDLEEEGEDVGERGRATHARVSPAKGKDVLIPVEYLPTLGVTFEFHRRRYVWNGEMWSKIRCRTNMETAFFENWRGLEIGSQIEAARLRFGRNIFEVKQPTFADLYKKQLLSPFTIFQLFCVILWMLDDYWQYSAFTLFMILTFEATVVFSRIKSLGALRGMGNKSRVLMVYRMGVWTKMDSHDLLPGDILSLTRNKRSKEEKEEEDGNDIIPADLLLLQGGTVVSEASLTGESVPQMKEGMTEIVEGEHLSMKIKHKSHILYAGTKLLQCKAWENEFHIPPPPDNGCVCFVLRTGFSSAQGKLVRMIEGSQEKVKGHEKETGLLLLLLFFFAVASSGYVLYKGMQEDNRSQYELLLHCILIITSVIPPELPMQMALAVNNSLMTLMKLQIFCTEPYRVPMAGKLDYCLFDKTGTLTTDELVAVGVVKDSLSDLTPMSKVVDGAGLVLAGCHSLVNIDEEIHGDPLEIAGLQAMCWTVVEEATVCPIKATEKQRGGNPLKLGAGADVHSLEVLARHHFSSKLQRMSCVVKDDNSRHFAVAKGSPEIIATLIHKKPSGYEAKSKDLAKRGYRVIAMAYKELTPQELSDAMSTRAKCEKDLVFAGFIAFTCRVRKDTKSVVERLKEGGMGIIMITGDALLTATHVAKQVGICDAKEGEFQEDKNELAKLLKRKKRKKEKPKPILFLERENGMHWQKYEDDTAFMRLVVGDIPNLSKHYDLAVTGKNMTAAFEHDEEFKKMLGHFKIFARMTPDAKETVIECLHSVDTLCLMCGDGANDVGALKQADVGVALLSGFGDINVDRGEDDKKKKAKEEIALLPPNELEKVKVLPLPMLKMKLRSMGVDLLAFPDLTEKEDLLELYTITASELAKKQQNKKKTVEKMKTMRVDAKAKYRSEAAIKQNKMTERIAELEAQGVQWAQFRAMKEFWAAEMSQGKKRKAEIVKKNSIEGSAASIAGQLDDLEMDALPSVQIGDASIAAPFTSKMPSIRSCVDIVRQGRCTLVTSIQMYQIMALNCLISAYSLSVLYLDGVKYGDTQMTCIGLLHSISFMSVSRSKPLDRLSPVKPLTSIFHPSLFISLLGQFAIHLGTMVMAVREAKEHLPSDHVVELDGLFKPGIVNSVVFLVSSVQQVTVFAVNLQGRPFMNGITENRPLLWSLVATFILTFMLASESVPSLNKYIQLVPFPDDSFRDYIITILAADLGLSFLLDRVMKLIFCPHILWASVQGTTLLDVIGLAKTFGVILFIMYNILGNNETWEEMMAEEARLEESLLLNDTNSTLDMAIEAAKVCVGLACNGTSTYTEDEFEL